MIGMPTLIQYRNEAEYRGRRLQRHPFDSGGGALPRTNAKAGTGSQYSQRRRRPGKCRRGVGGRAHAWCVNEAEGSDESSPLSA